MAIYSYLYPFDPESLRRIAYYFDFDYAADADPTGYAADVIAYAALWQRDTNRGTLTYVTAPDGRLTLLDTRPERTIAQLTLCGLERAAYESCDELHAVAGVTRHLHDRFPDVDFTERAGARVPRFARREPADGHRRRQLFEPGDLRRLE